MIRAFVLLASLSLPIAAHAQEAASSAPPQRIRSVILQKEEKCPLPSTPDEVVVCSSAEPDQFRIPKLFRDLPRQGPESTAWGVKVDRVMEDNRKVLPGSCTPIGSGGQTGCSIKAAEAWAADRRAKANGYDQPQ